MIKLENFTVKRDITDDLKFLEAIETMPEKVFTAGFSSVLKSFDFTFTKKQDLETQSRWIYINKETEWFFDDQQKSINCFFSNHHTEEVFLSLIFKDKYYQVQMDKNCIYFLPSWMSYKFLTKEETTQSIVHFWFFSDTQIKNKETGVWW